MIFLAVTPVGLRQAQSLARDGDAIWCGSDAIAAAEFTSRPPAHLTRLTYPLNDQEAIDRALDTIAEHHPQETVWIEASARD